MAKIRLQGGLTGYSPKGVVEPTRFPRNWNHTFELTSPGSRTMRAIVL